MLLKSHWSENVYAETIEILRNIDENNVWICAKRQAKNKRNKLQAMLKDVEFSHRIEYYSSERNLVSLVKKVVGTRIEELKMLGSKVH